MMGIVITYEGRLDDVGRLNELIGDLKLRCRRLEWDCQEVNERILGEAYYYVGQTEEVGENGRLRVTEHVQQRPVDERIRGVFIQPPKLGTFILTFDRAGTLMYYHALRGQVVSTETPLGTAMSGGGHGFAHSGKECDLIANFGLRIVDCGLRILIEY